MKKKINYRSFDFYNGTKLERSKATRAKRHLYIYLMRYTYTSRKFVIRVDSYGGGPKGPKFFFSLTEFIRFDEYATTKYTVLTNYKKYKHLKSQFCTKSVRRRQSKQMKNRHCKTNTKYLSTIWKKNTGIPSIMCE